MKKSYWTGISRDEIVKATSEISTIIDKHAIILNFQRFSDISFGIAVEIEERKINELYNGLKSIMSMEGYTENRSDSTAECVILINITFTKGTGDVEIEVPNIPK